MQALPKFKGKTLIRLNEKGQKLFMTLCTDGDLGKHTNRDVNSHYVIATPEKSKAIRWELIPQSDNTVMIACDCNGKKYHVCCHTFYPQDTRDVNSMFLLAHTDASQPNTKWHVKEHKGGMAFCQAGNNFDLQNWTIGCHDFYKYSEVEGGKMKRADQVAPGSNALSCMVHRDFNMPRLSWKIMKAGEKMKGMGIDSGMFKISLAEKGEKMFLSLAGNDEIGKLTNRDVNSQFVIAVNKKKMARSWKVTKHPDNTYSFECELEGKHYHLCCHSFYPTDERDVNSKYVLAHTDGNQPNTKWQIQEVKPGVFAVIQAQNQFELQGWRLGCHQFYSLQEVSSGKMKRADFIFEGKKNVLNCIVHKNSGEPRLLWKFHRQ